MREALRAFERVSRLINEQNKRLKRQRFYRLFDTDDMENVQSFGVYDSDTKRYVILESVNFNGNFRYSSLEIPSEIQEMFNLLKLQ